MKHADQSNAALKPGKLNPAALRAHPNNTEKDGAAMADPVHGAVRGRMDGYFQLYPVDLPCDCVYGL